MTPQQKNQLEQLHQIKVTLFQCYSTEADFAAFLMECLEKYGSGLPVDETFRVKWFSDRIYALIRKIKASDDFLQGNSSDKDFTEPAAGLCYLCG